MYLIVFIPSSFNFIYLSKSFVSFDGRSQTKTAPFIYLRTKVLWGLKGSPCHQSFVGLSASTLSVIFFFSTMFNWYSAGVPKAVFRWQLVFEGTSSTSGIKLPSSSFSGKRATEISDVSFEATVRPDLHPEVNQSLLEGRGWWDHTNVWKFPPCLQLRLFCLFVCFFHLRLWGQVQEMILRLILVNFEVM